MKNFLYVPKGVELRFCFEGNFVFLEIKGSKGFIRKKLLNKSFFLRWANESKVFLSKEFEENEKRYFFLSNDFEISNLVLPSYFFKSNEISLVRNWIFGVSEGFVILLQIYGVGFQMEIKNEFSQILFHLGYSHPIIFQLPFLDVFPYYLEYNKSLFLGLESCDKDHINQIGVKLMNFRFPSVYTGRGIRILAVSLYQESLLLKLKEGKQKK